MEFLKHSFFFLLLISHLPVVLSLPLNETRTYEPNPTGRGTMGLLWSSTITFGLCIWTAIHPDIVPIRDGWSRTWYKFVWLLFAIAFPEFVVCCAVSQRWRARQIHQPWQETWEGDDDAAVKQWLGMSGAFFVVMGGYAVEAKRAPDEMNANVVVEERNASDEMKTLLTSNSRAHTSEQAEVDLLTTISTSGFEKLLCCEDFKEAIKSKRIGEAHFSRHNIEDKGKASSIAKLLVTLQILWMVVQCIGRKAAGLPVMPLELHVMIQICYAVVIYCCLWNKPLDVAEPICLALDAEVFSKLGFNIKEESRAYSIDFPFATEKRNGSGLVGTFYRAVYDIIVYFDPKVELWCVLLALISGGLHATAWNWQFPTSSELWLWRLACLGMGLTPLLLLLMVWKRGGEVYGVRMIGNLRFADSHPMKVVLAEVFKTLRDFIKGSKLDDDEVKRPPKGLPKWYPIWFGFLYCSVCIFLLVAYYVSITYLTVESFLILRKMPDDAYLTVEWSSLLPHF